MSKLFDKKNIKFLKLTQLLCFEGLCGVLGVEFDEILKKIEVIWRGIG